jgi:hypothetical protein
MNSVQKLLKEARGDLEPWIEIPDERILSTAKKCGATEIAEALSMLYQFEQERRALPEWDGDSSDDIWRAQVAFSKLLSGVPDEHLALVAEGLKSDSESVRFYTALALKDRGACVAKQWLQAALLAETRDLNRRILREAIDACSKKGGFLNFFKR